MRAIISEFAVDLEAVNNSSCLRATKERKSVENKEEDKYLRSD